MFCVGLHTRPIDGALPVCGQSLRVCPQMLALHLASSDEVVQEPPGDLVVEVGLLAPHQSSGSRALQGVQKQLGPKWLRIMDS